MINKKIWKIFTSILVIVLFCTIILFTYTGQQTVYAAESIENVKGEYYEFDAKNDYEFSIVESSAIAVTGENTFGIFSLSGNFTEAGERKDIPTYSVKDGNLDFSYDFDKSLLNVEETEWHLIDDKAKKVDIITLENNIMKGTLILQSSLDGETWIEDVIKTDIFNENTDLNEAFYITKNIQQQNGCYFRVIVAYEMEKKTGSHKVALVTVDDILKKKIAEVYEFYIIDNDISNSALPNAVPRMELGSKINTGKDNGYSGNNSVDKDDPHYGWDLGMFYVNGYTRESKNDDGNIVFMKNVGDKVTLWFNLKQNINELNGSDDLIISEDKKGYYKEYEIEQTNFGHGALIVRYTDYEGVIHDPVIYTNYLKANARTGANTRVQLFEEGDYEVTLNYEIKNNPRKLGPISVVPTYSNYKIAFEFSIRNGNCMVFPFDIIKKNELFNNAITENGFKLDMAKSRYLTIDVTKSVLKVDTDGYLTEDIRFNRPAKDGEVYSDEGIYTFTTKNLYTDSIPTTKTIYVGDNKYFKTFSKFGISIRELNGKIASGVEIEDDGTIVESVEEKVISIDKETTEAQSPNIKSEEVSKNDESLELEILNQENGANIIKMNKLSAPIIIGIILIVCVIFVFVIRKRKSSRQNKWEDGNK
ncbi:hypothetical protein QUF55_08755 [Clostridiaceae bacterium HSG29]|nr:hypothetical protein [Clostridiaceae bacterium HSG29]